MALLTRRNLLKASAIAGAYASGMAFLPRLTNALAAADPVTLEAYRRSAMIDGKAATEGVMSYRLGGGDVANATPPVLRARRGEPFAARFLNNLDEPSTVHWHGLRIDNAMDGVPFLTQPYVYPGDGFDYAFTPPDAGTYWYHPHCNTLEQIGRGLAGMFIVEDPDDPVFDAEVAINLRDWRLGGNSQFIEQFKARDAAKGGTFGTVRTANWQLEPSYDAPAGGLVRLRILVSDVTRIFNLKMVGADALIIALDGQPVPEHTPLDTVVISPGQRLDLVVRMPDTEGETAALEDIRPSTPKIVARLRSVGSSLKRNLGDVAPLAPNPPVEADLANAIPVPLVLSATAENAAKDSICGSLGYSFWAINKVPYPGDSADPMDPLVEMKLGKTYIFNLENVTPHAHPIHIHGMNFKVVSSSKGPVSPLVSDTYLVLPDEKVQLAVVADNPGNWVLHCHIIEHQKTGMTSYVRVV